MERTTHFNCWSFDLLVTGMDQCAVDNCFSELNSLSVKDRGPACKVWVCVSNMRKKGVNFNQEVEILDMLKEHGLEMAHGVRVPITPD